ncbi:MAG: hypothetical protein OES38_00040 [Gammaproteobacteria bacterium]|nr:hypothetical protein [Gammaproteobacteria bacterium]
MGKVRFLLLSWMASVLLPGCGVFEEEEEYRGFGRTHYELNARPESFEAYVNDRQPARDEHFFDCLAQNLQRLDREISANVAACDEECGDDAVCKLDCNTRIGTDFLEADEQLILLERAAIRGEDSYDTAIATGRLLSDLVCLAVNTGRDLSGLPQLSCEEVWAELESEYVNRYTCKYERYIWE